MPEPQRYVSAERLQNDDFGDKFTRLQGELVYDAKTKQGPWATMTHASFLKHAVGTLGLGKGQKYQRQANGQLHKIEG